jgi:hypothetical protein
MHSVIIFRQYRSGRLDRRVASSTPLCFRFTFLITVRNPSALYFQFVSIAKLISIHDGKILNGYNMKEDIFRETKE